MKNACGRPVCGGEGQLGTASPHPKNVDTCIAIAGLPSNNTIAVRKYCVPKAQGKGVRGAPTETWFVWYRYALRLSQSSVYYSHNKVFYYSVLLVFYYCTLRPHTHTHNSEDWAHTLVELRFLDSVSGDALVALRNNKGGPLATGPPEHFVSVHPRAIQQQRLDGVLLFDVMYRCGLHGCLTE